MNEQRQRVELASVLATPTKGGEFVGESYDHGAVFRVSEANGVRMLTITMKLDDVHTHGEKKGQPLKTGDGAQYWKGWSRWARVAFTVFAGPDGMRIKLQR